MGDTPVLPAVGIGTGKCDAEAEEASGGGQVKETRIDDASASDPNPNAASALTDASKPPALSVPGDPRPAVRKKRSEAVHVALALLASQVLSAFAAISGKLTPARAVFLVSTLVALWRSAGQPWRAVWTFTVIAISYLALWTIYLTAALQPLTILVSLSYVMLLAISVTHLRF